MANGADRCQPTTSHQRPPTFKSAGVICMVESPLVEAPAVGFVCVSGDSQQVVTTRPPAA
jgi:hypothetical protein